MPNYRIEALVYHKEKDHEDTLEKQVLSALYEYDCTSVNVVALKVYPNGV